MNNPFYRQSPAPALDPQEAGRRAWRVFVAREVLRVTAVQTAPVDPDLTQWAERVWLAHAAGNGAK